MPTDELERELRRAFASRAAGYQHAEQARRRLLQRNYQPGNGHRRLAAGLTAVAATGAVVLGLGLSGALGSAQGRQTGAIRTAAFTLTRNANGTDTLTINPQVLIQPTTLQNDLAEYGIPATVTTGSFCSTDPPPVGFGQVVTFSQSASGSGPVQDPTLTINPAAMPAGTELSFGNFQLASGAETVFALINTSSNTCTSTAPTTPPAGGVMLSYAAPPGS